MYWYVCYTTVVGIVKSLFNSEAFSEGTKTKPACNFIKQSYTSELSIGCLMGFATLTSQKSFQFYSI